MKKRITIELDDDAVKELQKRAKKNFFSLREQIEDIIRRSAVASKRGRSHPAKVDDKFVTYFSREMRGRPKKKKKKKK